LMSGFMERAPEANTRWIGTIIGNAKKASETKFVTGVVRIPASEKSGTLDVTIRARAPRDGARLMLKNGEQKLATFRLSQDFADYQTSIDMTKLKAGGESVLLELTVDATPDEQGRVLGAELQSLAAQRNP
jgi:hypothetical protein